MNKNATLKYNPKRRNSSIELLRILSMLMIIFHHFAVHGNFSWDNATLSVPRFWYDFIIMGGKIGVNIFVLISGYFLVSDNGTLFNFKKILKFWGQIFFYSVGLFALSLLLGITDFSISGLIRSFFPITLCNGWWFVGTYFVLFLIHPFLNVLLNGLNKKMYQALLVMLVIIWSLIPTFTATAYQGNNLLWFVCLYSIAGYVRLYGLNAKLSAKHYFLIWLVSSAVTYASRVLLIILGTKSSFLSKCSSYFYDQVYNQEQITVLIASLSLFMLFLGIKLNYNKWINIIASTTFGVYLIHDNNVLRSFLWIDLFENSKYQNSLLLIPYSIIVVLIVFIVCALIDICRQKIFEKPFVALVNKYSDRVEKLFAKIIDFFKKIVFGQ